MNCPFCGEKMDEVQGKYVCPGGGRLLTKESGPCPYKGEKLTEDDIVKIEVFLIDNDMDD